MIIIETGVSLVKFLHTVESRMPGPTPDDFSDQLSTLWQNFDSLTAILILWYNRYAFEFSEELFVPAGMLDIRPS